MNSKEELEELISTIRTYIRKVQMAGDCVEYLRLCEELRLTENALSSLKDRKGHGSLTTAALA